MNGHSFYLFISSIILASIAHSQWFFVSTGLPISWNNVVAIDASDSATIVIAFDSSVIQSKDCGNTWKEIGIATFESHYVADVSIIDSNHIWVACDNGAILATSDGGVHWTSQFFDSTKSIFMNSIKFFDLTTGFAMGDGPNDTTAILRTVDGGNHWSSANMQQLKGWSGDLWRRLDFVNNEVSYFYVSGVQLLYKTTDGGLTWNPTSTQPPYVQIVKFFNENIGIIIADTGRIFRTIDGGNSWQSYVTSHKGWGNDIEFAPGDPSRVWLTDNLNIYFSNDTGKTWIKQCEIGGRDIIFTTTNKGWFVGDNGKLYNTTNGGITAVPAIITVPNEFLLYQNYPNPFNPTTMIEFEMPQSQFVELVVFDMLGRKIATLVEEQLSAGSHKIEFNGNQLSSGLYVYHISAGEYQATQKMMLLK